MHAQAWQILTRRGNEVGQQIQDGRLARTPAAGLVEQIQDDRLASPLVAGLVEQIQDDRLAG